MIRVLFVDDEPAILEGLENRLRRLRGRWDMRFANGAVEALAQMDSGPVDVIVSDMRMPGIDGADLLETVRERHPHVVRFILSGETSDEGAMRLLPVAHQMLTKPCDAGALERSIERICGLQSRMEHPALQRAMGLLRSLPALPRLYWDLLREIDKPRSGIASIAAIIEQDVAMTARLLQMSNSAFFGSGRRVTSVKDAIAALGLLPIRSIVVQLQLFRAMSDVCSPPGFSLEALQSHSLQIARLAASMLRNAEARQTAFSAGMLHDIGYLALAVGLPEECAAVKARITGTGEKLIDAEFAILGCNHAEIGAHMLNLWGLPLPLIEAVAYHHSPLASGEQSFGAIAAIHVANILDADQAADPAFEQEDGDGEFLGGLGVAEAVAAWRRGEPIVAI